MRAFLLLDFFEIFAPNFERDLSRSNAKDNQPNIINFLSQFRMILPLARNDQITAYLDYERVKDFAITSGRSRKEQHFPDQMRLELFFSFQDRTGFAEKVLALHRLLCLQRKCRDQSTAAISWSGFTSGGAAG